MRGRFTLFSLSLVAFATMCGCSSLVVAALKPSDKAKHFSYTRAQGLFAANRDSTLRQTAIVISGEWESQMPHRDSNTGTVFIPKAKGGNTIRGLAVCLAPDGYLATASHVVSGMTNFVLAEFDGRFDIRPARVVRQMVPPDIAVLKVPATLAHCAMFDERPGVGDHSFAVVAYSRQTPLDVNLDFAAGTIRETRSEQPLGRCDVVRTDVPLWRGDSGGPLFSSTGQLIGIASIYKIDFHWLYWKRRSVYLLPKREFIESVIAEDRLSHR